MRRAAPPQATPTGWPDFVQLPYHCSESVGGARSLYVLFDRERLSNKRHEQLLLERRFTYCVEFTECCAAEEHRDEVIIRIVTLCHHVAALEAALVAAHVGGTTTMDRPMLWRECRRHGLKR